MTRIYDYSPYSVLSHSSSSLKWIYGSTPRVLSSGGGLPLGFDVEAFTVFRLMVLAIFFFCIQHKSIFNRTSGSNIDMMYLRKSWLQSTSARILEKYVNYTKEIKLCGREIVS